MSGPVMSYLNGLDVARMQVHLTTLKSPNERAFGSGEMIDGYVRSRYGGWRWEVASIERLDPSTL